MGEFLDVLLFEGAALGLHFTELFEGLQEAAGEALLVDGEVFERVGGVAQGFGEGESGVGFGMARLPKIPVFHVADGEEVVLGGGDAVESELQIGAGVGKLGFDDSDGGHAFDEGVGELMIGGHFFLGEMEGLGKQAVARGVEGGTLFAFGGDGTLRVFGVLAVGAEAGGRRRTLGRLRRGAVSGTGFGFGKGGRMLACPRNWCPRNWQIVGIHDDAYLSTLKRGLPGWGVGKLLRRWERRSGE